MRKGRDLGAASRVVIANHRYGHQEEDENLRVKQRRAHLVVDLAVPAVATDTLVRLDPFMAHHLS